MGHSVVVNLQSFICGALDGDGLGAWHITMSIDPASDVFICGDIDEVIQKGIVQLLDLWFQPRFDRINFPAGVGGQPLQKCAVH